MMHYAVPSSNEAYQALPTLKAVAGWRLLHLYVGFYDNGSRSNRVVKSVLLNQTSDNSCVGGTLNVTCLLLGLTLNIGL
jgi:hypothetical protein